MTEVTDLLPGDIIFFVNTYKEDSEPDDGMTLEPQVYVDHVTMFVGLDEKGRPRLVHSIQGKDGPYQPKKVSGLCMTTLGPLKDQEEEGRRYDVNYRVFRSTHSSIAAKALEILTQQSRYRIPYDEQRLREKIALEEEGKVGDDFKEMGEEAYRKSGIFRSIKYAARCSSLLTRTRGDGIGRGLTCSMSVILAYQMAELILDEQIIPIDPSSNQWPSDKYAAVPEDSSDGSLSQSYRTYLSDLRTSVTKERNETGLRLSLSFWKGSKPAEDYRHQTFRVDCKYIGAEGMYLYMLDFSDEWKPLGDLDVPQPTFPDKTEYLKQLSDGYQESLNRVSEMVRLSPVVCSSSNSSSPVPPDLAADLWWTKEFSMGSGMGVGSMDGVHSPNPDGQPELFDLVGPSFDVETRSTATDTLVAERVCSGP